MLRIENIGVDIKIHVKMQWYTHKFSDSTNLERGSRTILLVFPSFFGLGLADGHTPTFWLLRSQNARKF